MTFGPVSKCALHVKCYKFKSPLYYYFIVIFGWLRLQDHFLRVDSAFGTFYN